MSDKGIDPREEALEGKVITTKMLYLEGQGRDHVTNRMVFEFCENAMDRINKMIAQFLEIKEEDIQLTDGLLFTGNLAAHLIARATAWTFGDRVNAKSNEDVKLKELTTSAGREYMAALLTSITTLNAFYNHLYKDNEITLEFDAETLKRLACMEREQKKDESTNEQE